eukprot:g13983.t1
MSRGGKGGKGPKPTFTRVIPKFLQQYETMLTGPKPRPDGEEAFSGGGDFTDGGSGGSGSGMPGRGRGRGKDSSGEGGSGREGVAAAAASGGGGGGGGGNGFGDYDEEEVAALEAYMKTHPSREEDKEALRKRAKELSARIGSGQGATAKGGSESGGSASGASKPPPPPEEPIEYTDATGRLKFNKRPGAGGSGARAGEDGDEGAKGRKKKGKRAKLAKLNNTKLLSFGDDEDG